MTESKKDLSPNEEIIQRDLLSEYLTDIYHEHGMKDYSFLVRNQAEIETQEVPRIICSEALV